MIKRTSRTRTGNLYTVSLTVDHEGFLERECSSTDCKGLFLIKPGTGLTGDNLPCICPYCGLSGEFSDFTSREQIEYAQSLVLREASKQMSDLLRGMDRRLRQSTRNSLIKLSVDVKASYIPVRHVRDKSLETEVRCPSCTLDYKVYGVFAFCPYCGKRNSLFILEANFLLIGKLLDLAERQDDPALSAQLLNSALAEAVAKFDGYGRELAELHASKATQPTKVQRLTFQNLKVADEKVEELWGFRLRDALREEQWEAAHALVQKRHLLAHKMGVVDKKYQTEVDPSARVGRKISIQRADVVELTAHLRLLAEHLSAQFESI